MSNIAVAWAWHSKAVKNEKLLLLFLADNADCFGSGANLTMVLAEAGAFCGIESAQTIRGHFESLVANGLVTERGNEFKLNISPEPRPRKTFNFQPRSKWTSK